MQTAKKGRPRKNEVREKKPPKYPSIYMSDKELVHRFNHINGADNRKCHILAELNGVPYAVMHNTLGSLGLVDGTSVNESAEHKHWGKAEIAEAIRMREKGIPCARIAEILGRTEHSVRARLLACGVKAKPQKEEAI